MAVGEAAIGSASEARDAGRGGGEVGGVMVIERGGKRGGERGGQKRRQESVEKGGERSAGPSCEKWLNPRLIVPDRHGR